MIDLHAELRESLARQRLEIPRRPYRKPRPLYVRGPAEKALYQRPSSVARSTDTKWKAKCLDCKTEVWTRNPDAPRCRECWRAFVAKPEVPEEQVGGATCRECKTAMPRRHANAIYCYACEVDRKRQQKRQASTAPCRACGNRIVGRSTSAVFCLTCAEKSDRASHQRSQAERAKRYRERKREAA